jgi:hypothetical protein
MTKTQAEIQQASQHIVNLIEQIDGMTRGQKEHLETLQESFKFYIKNEVYGKALYTCKEVITFLLDEFFVEVGDSFLPKSAIEVFRMEVSDEDRAKMAQIIEELEEQE